MKDYLHLMKKYSIHICAGVLALLLVVLVILYVSSGAFLRKEAMKDSDNPALFDGIAASIALFPLKACFESFPCISALQYPFLFSLVSSFESFSGDIYECTTSSGLLLFLQKPIPQERGSCKLIWHNKARVTEEEKQELKKDSEEIVYKQFEYSLADNRVLFEYPQGAALKAHANGISFSLESKNEQETKSVLIDVTVFNGTNALYTKNEISKLLERGWKTLEPHLLKTGVQVQGYAVDLLAFPEKDTHNCNINYAYVMPVMVNSKEQTVVVSFEAFHRQNDVSTNPQGDSEMSWCTLYEDGVYTQYKNILSHILSTLE